MNRKSAIDKVLGKIEEDTFLPDKISNITIQRQVNDRGCSYCFPHGIETDNATSKKNRKSWKNNRKQKYKLKNANRWF